jgi:hypothetical protein
MFSDIFREKDVCFILNSVDLVLGVNSKNNEKQKE